MGTIVAIILLVVVVGLAIFAVARSVRIVPQARAGIVERFGRYHRTLNAGLNVMMPFIDRLRPLIDLREQVVSFPPQPVITKDNLVVGINTVIYFQVTDPKAATYEIANYVAAVEQLTVTTLRNVVGGMDLETTLTSRDKINGELRKELDEATGRWGLRVGRVELKAIEPPASIQGSMEKQMRADRDKRAAILSAEGAKQSAILTAEGERQAAVLRARGEAEATVVRADAEATAQATRARGEAQAIATVFQAIHEGNPDQQLLAYKYLEMLPEIAQGGANKLWIVPSELGKALEGIGGFFGNAGTGAADARRPRQIEEPPDDLPGQDGSGSITRLPLLSSGGTTPRTPRCPRAAARWQRPPSYRAAVLRLEPGGRPPVPPGVLARRPDGKGRHRIGPPCCGWNPGDDPPYPPVSSRGPMAKAAIVSGRRHPALRLRGNLARRLGCPACGLVALAPWVARTWTWPESLTRVSNAGCLAVAGPCSTVPSLSRKVEPCHGQVTQASPPCWRSVPGAAARRGARNGRRVPGPRVPRRTASTPR